MRLLGEEWKKADEKTSKKYQKMAEEEKKKAEEKKKELSGEITALNAGLEREPFMKTRSGFPLAISGANTATAQRNRMAASPDTAVLLFRNFFHISRAAEYSC